MNEDADITAPTDHGIEGDHIVSNHIDNDIDGIITPESNMTPDMTDFLENDLLELDVGCDGHDWNINKNLLLMGSLNEYAANFTEILMIGNMRMKELLYMRKTYISQKIAKERLKEYSYLFMGMCIFNGLRMQICTLNPTTSRYKVSQALGNPLLFIFLVI